MGGGGHGRGRRANISADARVSDIDIGEVNEWPHEGEHKQGHRSHAVQ